MAKGTTIDEHELKRIREKARVTAYYQGLNIRLQHIAADLAKIDAQNEMWENQSLETRSEESEFEHLYRIVYAKRLNKEAAEIRKITDISQRHK